MVIVGQKTLREKLGVDVMAHLKTSAQLKASVLKAQGHQDGAGMELTARFVGEPNDGFVLRARWLSQRSCREVTRHATWTMRSR